MDDKSGRSNAGVKDWIEYTDRFRFDQKVIFLSKRSFAQTGRAQAAINIVAKKTLSVALAGQTVFVLVDTRRVCCYREHDNAAASGFDNPGFAAV